MSNSSSQDILDISSNDLHPDWLEKWQVSAPNKSFRDNVENNSRLSNRIIKNILLQNDIDLENNIEADENFTRVYSLLKKDRERFFDLCGLTLMGSSLRKIIDPKKLSLFLDAFDAKTLQLAIRTDIDYPPFAKTHIEPDRLADFVRTAGMRCVMGWAFSLNKPLGLYVKILLPKSFSSLKEQSNAIDKKTAAKAVYALAKQLELENNGSV